MARSLVTRLRPGKSKARANREVDRDCCNGMERTKAPRAPRVPPYASRSDRCHDLSPQQQSPHDLSSSLLCVTSAGRGAGSVAKTSRPRCGPSRARWRDRATRTRSYPKRMPSISAHVEQVHRSHAQCPRPLGKTRVRLPGVGIQAQPRREPSSWSSQISMKARSTSSVSGDSASKDDAMRNPSKVVRERRTTPRRFAPAKRPCAPARRGPSC